MANKVNIDISNLHRYVRFKLNNFLKKCEEKKQYVIITCGYRSAKEQDELYKQGRTKPGNIVTNAKGGYSQHNWGVAFDIAMNHDIDGDKKVTDDTWNLKGFKSVAKLAKSVGLSWGGDWKSFKDNPHFYYSKWGDTTKKLRKKYGTFTEFKKTWTGTVKCNTYLRKGKSFTSKVTLTIPKDKKVEICYKSKVGYALVYYDGQSGYIRTKNLK